MMEPRKLVIIASILYDEFENDDKIAIAAFQQNASKSNLSLSFYKERQQHFRLGHLIRSDLGWIDRYLDTDFHDRCRMKKDTFRELVNVIRPFYPVKLQRGNAPLINVESAVLMTLHYLGHEMSMDDVGDRYGKSLSSVHKEVHQVVSILCRLKSKFIVWPKEDECVFIQQQFMARAGFPGVIGAIDGCHVEVLAPANDQDSYTDRKMRHSVILQGICTATKIFTNISVGTPGSRNDNRALAFSSVHQRIQTHGHRSVLYQDNYHLIGDKAYPNRSWLMAPYKNYGNLTRRQRHYNYKHSVTRVVIEHVFGLLKGRWRRLLCLVLKDIAKDSDFITAACVLHNFCYLHNDEVIRDMVDDVRMLNAYQNQGAAINDNVSKEIGRNKRIEISEIL